MITFQIRGVVREQETGVPLPGLFVKAYDKDLLFDDLLGSAVADAQGRFEIVTERADFRDLFEKHPDLYFRVSRAKGGPSVFTTEHAVRWNVSQRSRVEIRIPWARMHDPAAIRVQFAGDDDQPRESFEVGESLSIAARGLRPMQPHDIHVSVDGRGLFTARLLSDTRGAIESTVLWPQMGLDDPSSETRFSPDEADEYWAGKALTIRTSARGDIVSESSVRLEHIARRPLVVASDSRGRLLNAFESGAQPLYLAMRALPITGPARVYLVPRQHEWRVGDLLAPVNTRDGGVAVREMDLPDTRRQAVVEIFAAGSLYPGAYDVVIRPLRYGYEEDDRPGLLRTDIVTGRRVTGLVIRESFWKGKPVLGGCVNRIPVSGRSISGAPYFRYSEAFAVGEDVWAAIDPGLVDPANLGKMCALYVIPSKTDAQWNADNSLNHLAVLGGNGAVQKIKLQAGCVNANKVKVWPAAMQPGEYDIVADFGNNVPDLMNFVPDDAYNTPLDVIDGYFVAGFRVVEDPGTLADFVNAGTWHYDEATVAGMGLAGTVTVKDELGDYYGGAMANVDLQLPMKAHVFYPADMAGVTDPAQISTAHPDYPVVVIVHGNGHDYTSYDFLLEHLARNGFVAASIHLPTGMNCLGRANAFFQHMVVLETKFGATIQNNVGVMGHSRGGEAVVKIPRVNQQNALGHTIAAVMSLAPTDQYGREVLGGAWATPFFVLYGSRDGDIKGEAPSAAIGNSWRICGFSLFDRASDATKSMMFVYKATHNGFITTNSDNGEPGVLAPSTQKAITQAYAAAFFRWQLRNEPQWLGMFTGEWRPSSITATGAECYTQYREAGAKPIDTFEGLVADWQTSTIGGSVGHGGTLPVEPSEGRLVDAPSAPGLDPKSPHDTKGLKIRWNTLGDRVMYSIPAADRDFSAFSTLSLRLTQKEGSASNAANQPQDLRVSLKDAANNERAVRASAFGAVPYPDQRADSGLRKSALTTIRIPLSSYTIVCAGQPKVDLHNVVELALVFSMNPTGEIEVDDVEITN